MTLQGRQIGHIRIIDRLGEGGMGEVYLAYDSKLERKVAAKAIRGDKQLDQKAKSRFVREAKTLSKLEHQNICRLYDLIEDEQGDFLIMELVKGMRLREVLVEERSPRERLRIAQQIASGLAAAHAMNIVHLDLKPENVMLTHDGIVKILDFGLARSTLAPHNAPQELRPLSSDHDPNATVSIHSQTATVRGTPRYMSPEQAQGEQATTASDMYSLGLMMQELFTGASAYPGNLSMESQIWKAMHAETLPVKGLTPGLARLIDRLKNSHPNLRPSAVETSERLLWLQQAPRRRLQRWVALSFFCLLALGATFSSIGFYRAKKSERAAQKMNDFLREMLVEVDPKNEGIDLRAVDLVRDSAPRIDRDFADYPQIRGDLHQTFAQVLAALGDYQGAKQHADIAFGLRKDRLGEGHQKTLGAMNEAANARSQLGDYRGAESMQRELLRISQDRLGPNHRDTLTHMSNLAITLSLQGHYEEAEALQRRVVEAETKLLGARDPSALISMGNHAQTLLALGRVEEAETAQRRVAEANLQLMGPDDPDTLTARANLATTLSNLDRNHEAVEILKDVLKRETRILGEDHPGTHITRSSLANSLKKIGKMDEARDMQRLVVAGFERAYGTDHPYTLVAMGNLSATLSDMGQYAQARSIQEDLVTRFEASLGPDHPNTIIAKSNLAKTRWRMGEIEDAIDLQGWVLHACRRVMGPDHPVTAKATTRLADMERDLQNPGSSDIDRD